MSDEKSLHISPEQRAYLDYFKEGGLTINLPTKKQLEYVSDSPPWEFSEYPLTDEMDEELDDDAYENMDPNFKQSLVAGKFKDAVQAAIYRGDYAVAAMAQMEALQEQNAFHAARLIVKAVQAKLEARIKFWKEKDSDLARENVASYENLLDAITKDFMDLSKVMNIEDGKIRRNIVDIV